jgi:hypothetical protein
MEDLTLEEVKQLLKYYKQKTYDLEFQLLLTQVRLNKATSIDDE